MCTVRHQREGVCDYLEIFLQKYFFFFFFDHFSLKSSILKKFFIFTEFSGGSVNLISALKSRDGFCKVKPSRGVSAKGGEGTGY